MKALRLAVIVALGSLFLSSAASADVKLSLANGRVSIVAHDATVRQILAEWARVGQITIVNLERIPGGPETIELANVPEAEALELLLRSISGFIAAPRAVPASATASQFDRIVVMPITAAPRPPAMVAASTGPVFPQPVQPPTPEDADEERGPGAPRGPIFNQYPQQPGGRGPAQAGVAQPFNPGPPQVVQPFNPGQVRQPFNPGQPQVVQPAQQPSSFPTAPFGGVAVPGMVAPAPQQPGQPVQSGVVQPGQPQRPSGPEGR